MKNKKTKIKILYIVLGTVILIELIIGFRVITNPTSLINPLPNPNHLAPASLAKFTLISDKKSYKAGSKITVNINMDTASQLTDGADVVLQFDPKVLEASPSDIIFGNVYDEYPAKEVNPELGTIRISGISKIGQTGFRGSGLFASVKFSGIKASQTKIAVDFTPGNTADSNIVESSSTKDILHSVENLNLTIAP